MKGQKVSPEVRTYILENKDRMFNNQMATLLNLNQATVRRIIKKETED
jgi:hypothetical protein